MGKKKGRGLDPPWWVCWTVRPKGEEKKLPGGFIKKRISRSVSNRKGSSLTLRVRGRLNLSFLVGTGRVYHLACKSGSRENGKSGKMGPMIASWN